MITILEILFCIYCVYLLSRKGYEKRMGKKLRFRDMFNPKKWDNIY